MINLRILMGIDIDENITKWEKDVIDTSKNNRLLYFDSEHFLKISVPSMVFLFDDLVNKDKRMGVHLSGDEENRKKDEIIFSKKENLGKLLNSLMYQSQNAIKEHGSNVLYVSFGILKWNDENGNKVETQLFFVPVNISKKLYETFKIEALEGDIFFNPVLQEKLEQFGIKFNFNFDNNLSITEAMKTFKMTVKEAKWTVNNNAYLGILSFTNNTIYNDIKNNHELIRNNDLTRGLAGDLPSIEKLKSKMPPETDYSITTILDADSSQIKAIYAARSGASFILNGPPGTGKSQTISNIITDALSANKSVLFVSEKNAAIEVVKKRLEDIGLGDFILNVHGNRPKTDVIKMLYNAIENQQNVTIASEPADRYTDILNTYVAAVHSKRGNIKRSIYEACTEELENKTEIGLKIDQGLINIETGQLDDLEFQISELNDYLDMIKDYKKFPESFNAEKYKENPEVYYKNIDTIRNEIAKLDSLAVKLNEFSGLAVEKMDDLENLFNITGAIDPDICLESEFLNPEYIDELYKLIEKREKLNSEYQYKNEILLKKYSENFLSLDLEGMKNAFEIYNSGIKRLASKYKELVREIQKYQISGKEKNYDALLKDLNYAIEVKAIFGELQEIGNSLEEKNINPEDMADKIRYARKILDAMPASMDMHTLEGLVNCSADKTILADVEEIYTSMKKALNYLGAIMPQNVIGPDISFAELANFIGILDSMDIDRYVKFRELMQSIEKAGIDIQPLLGMELSDDSISKAFKSTFNMEFANYWISNDNTLNGFNATSHERIINMFIDFDKKRMETNRKKLIHDLYASRAKLLDEKPEASMLIKTENAKKRMQKSVKSIFKELGPALTGIKPCIMMSPTNVSYYLDSGFKFDLLLFDEASQLTPPEAVGSLIRSNQAIISGDTQQLPPTTFFENINVSKDEGNYAILDNILDQFDALGLIKISLKWHYRSIDDRLIAFSNRYFYDGMLETFPSAYKNSENSGIHFVKTDGVYTRGKSRINKAEAGEVVRLIREELSNSNSIGVVTLSETQRSAIEDTLYSYVRHDPVLAEILNKDEIFIKNLENVQGDEKDIIIISTGYGRDEDGRLTMNFGPINTNGGEKRLNVAVTRARKKVIVVSSMDPEDIRIPASSGRGPELLKQYMIFAKSGGNESGFKQFDGSDGIIADLEKRLIGEGLTLERDIGYSKNNIPLAIVDPADNNHYILGIETDGHIYNSMKTASERERIRKSILNARGWELYRVWSIDYLKNPEKVVHNIVNTVNRLSSAIND
ncbi:MAG: AAA domain-containing protein [Ferroplasma sp.]